MLALILLIILICVALGIIGFVVKGLFYLFVIGIILFIITILSSFFRAGSRRGRKREVKNQEKTERDRE